MYQFWSWLNVRQCLVSSNCFDRGTLFPSSSAIVGVQGGNISLKADRLSAYGGRSCWGRHIEQLRSEKDTFKRWNQWYRSPFPPWNIFWCSIFSFDMPMILTGVSDRIGVCQPWDQQCRWRYKGKGKWQERLSATWQTWCSSWLLQMEPLCPSSCGRVILWRRAGAFLRLGQDFSWQCPGLHNDASHYPGPVHHKKNPQILTFAAHDVHKIHHDLHDWFQLRSVEISQDLF